MVWEHIIFLRRKRSLLCIPMDEHRMCLSHTLVVGVAYVDGYHRSRTLACPRSILQVQLTRALCCKAGVDPSRLCGFREWEAFQRMLGPSGVTLVCIDTK